MTGKEGRDRASRLLAEAANIGVSPCEIVSLFIERRRFGCWRFDGSKVLVSGNFQDVPVDAGDVASSQQIFTPAIAPEERRRLHAMMMEAFEAKAAFAQTYTVNVPKEGARTFRSRALYRAPEADETDLFGIAYQCFLPIRTISLGD